MFHIITIANYSCDRNFIYDVASIISSFIIVQNVFYIMLDA